MGRFIEETTVRVGLVGMEEAPAKKLIDRFTMATAHDPGTFEVRRFTSIAECRDALDSASKSTIVQAVCIVPEKFSAKEVTAFIGDVRVTHPLVPFCIVGTQRFLDELPGYHEAWKNRFAHYYKLAVDVSDDDFSENAGLLRDLFLVDSVKCRALGQYETTPGAVIQLKSPRPYGFWVIIGITLLAALVGGAVAPVLERVFPSPNVHGVVSKGAADSAAAPLR